MKIAYLTSYLGKEFMSRYAQGKKFALSGPFKSCGIARSMMIAGNKVIIYSPGIVTCDAVIPAFSETEIYPEGELIIKYCNIISKRRCDLINQIRISRQIINDDKQEHFDAIVYYNITFGAFLLATKMKHSIKVLEYEDNIFNKALVGDKNNFEYIKKFIYNKVIKHTDGVMAVCLGLQLKNKLKYSVLIPGIINEEVIDNVSNRVNKLQDGRPVHIFLTGGIHYSKGGDLLVNAMTYIKTPCIVSVYGNCDLSDSFKRIIKQVPSCHKFEFNGYMDHSELIKTLDRDADILINTTRSMHVGAQAAGFPFKMMEYASTGRPIVSSEIGKLGEEYNRFITYYEGEDPLSIAGTIETVIADYDAKVNQALKLQTLVLREYTIGMTGKKLGTFFKNIEDNENKEN